MALGLTLRQLRLNTTAAELPLWAAYAELHGLPLDRIEATAAITGAAQCQIWGAKVTPKDLQPVFAQPERDNSGAVLSSWAAQQNAHDKREHGERKSG